jgi:membrane-bound metal-dependent hydrolase YbcI (DUF457 family)
MGFCVPYAFTGDWMFSLVSAFAAVIPDGVEMALGFSFTEHYVPWGKVQRGGIFKHRGILHNPIFWTLVCLFFYGAILSLIPDEYKGICASLLLAVVVGIFLHLAGDVMTMSGVPLNLTGSKRMSLGLFRTGSLCEVAFVVLFILLAFGEWIYYFMVQSYK